MITQKKQFSIRLIRHATLVIKMGNTNFLVDPLLSAKDQLDPVPWSNEVRNPTVNLPIGENELNEIIATTDIVLLTHLHRDHWDIKAQELISKNKYIICQPEDEGQLKQQGYNKLNSAAKIEFQGITIERVGAQHGHGELAEKMAPASGYMIRWNEKTIYIAGDMVWCKLAEENLHHSNPDYIVVNAGAAQFNFGEPITMTTADILKTVHHSKPTAIIIAVHMESINHCRLTRYELRSSMHLNNLTERVFIPDDGETGNFQF